MWRPSCDSTPGYTGGKGALSPLHHPCSKKTYNDGLLDISVFQFRKELYFFFHSTKTNYHEQGLTHLVTARPYV